MSAPQSPPPNVQLMQYITGTWLCQATYVAAKLGIADLLKDGPKPSVELAKTVGAAPGPLFRVLRALAGFGVFRETTPGTFELTPMADCLRSDVPGSLRAVAVMFGSPWQRAAWSDILHAVRTDSPAFDHVHGMGFFDYCLKNPEAATVFDEAMTSFSSQEIPAVMEAFDFGAFHKVADIAGGHGSMLAAILKKHTAMRGVLFDMPSVIDGAKQHGHLRSAEDRCELVGGDFFKAVPAGCDGYILKHIIHDWSDDHSRTILKNIRRAIAADGKLMLVEMVIPPGNEPHMGKLLDLEMLVQTRGGRERTEPEFRDLFASAGFRLTRVVATKAPASVLEAVPA